MSVFDAEIIPANAVSGLKEGYSIRPLELNDYNEGVLDLLTVLTTVGPVSQDQFKELLEHWSTHNGTYFPVVITDQNHRVVACGTLIAERKLIHSRGLVGHIEDIAVAKDQQGLKLGKHLIQCLTAIGKAVGCYKVILDCDEKNVGFYEKCNYKRAGVEMEIRF